MGYTNDELAVLCKDTVDFADKLLLVFMKKIGEVGRLEAERQLQVACKTIEPPIYESVREELESLKQQ